MAIQRVSYSIAYLNRYRFSWLSKHLDRALRLVSVRNFPQTLGRLRTYRRGLRHTSNHNVGPLNLFKELKLF